MLLAGGQAGSSPAKVLLCDLGKDPSALWITLRLSEFHKSSEIFFVLLVPCLLSFLELLGARSARGAEGQAVPGWLKMPF